MLFVDMINISNANEIRIVSHFLNVFDTSGMKESG